ncbi:SGNH/GDSL hydrolase family protein [Nocardioides alcanivorans]|uniref:SGNH/GDSL hydrolase family protein n=1 Tax=Nocardioides alcanivorans TaxID=2897352 RepID=UPI001F40AE93|nr:SGNH/GDSL hydrolase family protein [Nocardioides alcanivorans]
MHKAAALSAVAALAGLVLSAVPAAGGPEPLPEATAVQEAAPAPEGDHYVAFGDSFVSGPGVRPILVAGCERSGANFPSLVAEELAVADFNDVSCGGAQTKDLTEPQVRAGFTNPPQLDGLTADTTLITFGTLGGNDMGLVGLAASCFVADCVADESGTQRARDGIESARVKMLAGLDEAKSRAPQAEIFVIGYGTYLPENGCPTTLPLDPAEFNHVQGLIDELSDMLAEVAAEKDVNFVDLRETPNIDQHTACAEPAKQWIRAMEVHNDGAMLHPSTCGHVAMAQQVIRTIREERGEDVPEFDDSCTGFGAPVEPEGPTDAERTAALRKALKSTNLTARCKAGKLKARVKGGKKQVVRVEFRLGERRLGVDKAAPYKLNKVARKLAKHKGKVRAVVRVRDKELRLERVIKVKRPACLKR